MVFFVNNSGVITNSFPEQVFEGSANANSFYVVAPFANNLTATVAFTLPNGIVTQPYGLTATGEISGFTDGSGNTYYGWSMELPNAVTTYYGKVIAQVAFYSANRLLCTSATTFTVSRGVAAVLPETPTEDVYQQILQALAELQSDLGNGYFVARAVYVWNSAYTYGAGELVYYPMGTYGVYVRSNVANNTQEPYTDGTINSNWSLALDFNAIVGVLSSAEDAAASAEAAANSASAAATSRAIAEQAATSASGSASAAATSESNAESAADRAEAAAQENEAALGNYYTKIEIDSGVAKTAEVTMDNTTYVVTVTLKSADGTVLSTSSVDLPLESVVVSGSYNNETQSIDLVLQNGSTVSIPVGDLVDGLASQQALDNVINGTTPVAKATNADNATTADTADKVQNALTLIVDGDTQTYDGSSPVSIELNTQSNTDPEAVHYTAQTLTSEQQAQARSNIGAQASGNYALQDGTYPNLNTPKTLYNLGAYDTYTSNGDGTATITRKTGIIIVDGTENINVANDNGVMAIGLYERALSDYASGHTDSPNIIYGSPFATDNRIGVAADGTLYARSTSNFTTADQCKAFFSRNPICLQYSLETAKTETVIDNVPLNDLPKSATQNLRAEWEKGLNLVDISKELTINEGSEQWRAWQLNDWELEDGLTYTIRAYKVPSALQAQLIIGNDYYGVSGAAQTFVYKKSENQRFRIGGNTVSSTTTFTPQVMLVKGGTMYFYQPYNASAHIYNPQAEFLKDEWQKGLNLFNKDDVIKGYSVSDEDGTIFANADDSASGFIPIKPNTRYIYTPSDAAHRWFAFYDGNKQYISGVSGDDAVDFVSPSNVAYVRLTVPISNLDTTMFVEGSHPYPYQPYNGEIVRSAGSYRDLQAGGLVPYLEANPQTDGISGTGYVCFFKQTNISGWQSWGATVLVTQGYDKHETSIVSIIGRSDDSVASVVRYEVIAGNDITDRLTYYFDSNAKTVYFYLAADGDAYCKFFKLGYGGNQYDWSVFPTNEKFQSSVSTTGQATCLVGRKTYRHLIHAGGTSAIADIYLGVTGSTEFALFINLESTQSTAMSVSDLRDFLQNAGTSAAGSIYPCDGYINITSGDPSKSGVVFVKGLIYRAENSVNNITAIYAGYSSNTWRTGIMNMGSDFAIYNDEVSEV